MKTESFALLLIGMFIMVIGVVTADSTFYPLPDEDKPFTWDFGFQTVVNGATCSTYPQDSGYTGDSSKAVVCPRSANGEINKGCALAVWYGYYERFAGERNMDAGTQDVLGSQLTYELYTCTNTQCECEGERNGGCGGGDCPDNLMQRVRDCDPAQCSWESTCVVRNECEDTACQPNWDCSDWSSCTSEGVQSRRCIDLTVCGTVDGKPTEVQTCSGGSGAGGSGGSTGLFGLSNLQLGIIAIIIIFIVVAILMRKK